MNRDRANATSVKTSEAIEWAPITEHVGLYHKEIVTAEEADALGIRASSVLWERINVGGAVLPHYHDVAEIIHITVGKVKLLCNGQWQSYKAGDTFHVPAGVVHSVRNDDVLPTEQVSIFLPASADIPPNRFFETTKVDCEGIVAKESEGADGGSVK
ncbi:cupin domain-containing protein [Paenibacillus sp. sptzw28]|uniref:cupin domain-containing protein n=1 Tax=Paenibacillus sp. sptzw28 TaxID=715179 RepID=UPI001C6F1398|nr:cupin domain-containing protein [Paenibacillus sp. sptzw28]QYR23643.1 cupin domain-containing protein [Paenibacillus sp. sptzw28]